jgi:hypothetical protein
MGPPYTLLVPQTAAFIGSPITVGRDEGPSIPATLYVVGLLDGVEEITVEYWDGATWRSSGQVLSVAAPVLSLYSALTIRINKPITTNAVGVGLNTAERVIGAREGLRRGL